MTLRETWESIDLQLLRDWVTTRRQEDLHLDFKQLRSAPTLTRDDNKVFAKAMSGFANSDGGIIVWGVDARKDENNVDAASELKPLAQPDAVLSRLHSMTGDACVPIVDGVEHRLISDGQGGGFIATLVPASDSGPHMAGLGEGRYYKRSGDSFYAMEHFDIADMFGRRAVPQLQLAITDKGGAIVNGRATSFEPVLVIRNHGRGLARFPYLRVRIHAPYAVNHSYELVGQKSGLPRRPQLPPYEWVVYAGGVNDVVHPGTFLDITRLQCSSRFDVQTVESLDDLVIEYELGCDGVRAQSGKLVRPGAEILEFLRADLRSRQPS